MLDRILVPLDGSEFGEQAVPLAGALARKIGREAELHLVHVHVSIPVFLEGVATVNPELESDREELEREYLAAVAHNVGKEWTGAVRWSVLHGSVDEAVQRYAEQEQVGLVVMSSHGRGGVSRAWLGSVADRLIRRLRRPLVVFRPPDDRAPAGYDVRRILVPLDGSDSSQEILPYVETLATETGAAVRILRVLPPYFLVGDPGLMTTIPDHDETMSDLADEARRYVREVAQRLRDRRVEVDEEVLTEVASAPGILEVAEREDVDLIAMATTGRGGLSRAILGSVADKVVRGAGCPVLLVRPPERRD